MTFAATCPEFPAGDPDAGFIHGFASLAGTMIDLTGGGDGDTLTVKGYARLE